jgi:two-component system nitrogen regulation response regulator GlnG
MLETKPPEGLRLSSATAPAREDALGEEDDDPVYRILVIDDEPVLRQTFQHLLEERGHTVWVADNGRSGIELCRRHKPDLVVTDIIMPQQDGLSMIEAIRREFPDMPFIVMTGVAGASSREKAIQLGIECCVSKPLDYVTLLRLIDQVVSTHLPRLRPQP